MKTNQNKNNLYTKGLSETEVAVLSIVKRFFEREPEALLGSIDSIVLEVLRRVKEELLQGSLVASVSSVNGKTGEVTLKAVDVGAEPTIIKSTAFNKDFGCKEDTICEGNDKRLTDKREPLEHKHEEYISTTDIDEYIETFLNNRGIFLSPHHDNELLKTVTVKGNLVVKEGEITEESNGKV